MIKTYKSKYNGDLEVSVQDGRKVLDSANTNYSYGSVQEVWQTMLRKIDLSDVKSILLLGLGGGTILKILNQEYKYTGKLTAVEIDPVIVKLASSEFGIKESSKLEIVCADAFVYVKKSKRKFDLILVDIFIDNVMPEQLLEISFWKKLAGMSTANGKIVFNAFHYSVKLMPMRTTLKEEGFVVRVYEKVEGSNTMIVGKNNMLMC